MDLGHAKILTRGLEVLESLMALRIAHLRVKQLRLLDLANGNTVFDWNKLY